MVTSNSSAHTLDGILAKETRIVAPLNLSKKKDSPINIVFMVPQTHFFASLSLGAASLQDYINQNVDCAIADRAFYYDFLVDEQGNLKSKLEIEQPVLSLDQRKPIRDADVLALSFSNPIAFPQFFKIMDLLDLPYRAAERESPLVIGGGSGFMNPEPMADFFDVAVIGHGYFPLANMLSAAYDWKQDDTPKHNLFKKIASLRGVYVPSLYEPAYDSRGKLIKTNALANAPLSVKVEHRLPENLRLASTVSVNNFGSILLTFGCKNSCNFCQLSRVPYKEFSLDKAKQYVEEFFDKGVNVIGIQSSSLTQVPYAFDLVDHILKNESARVVVGSVRLDSITDDLLMRLNHDRVISSYSLYLEQPTKSIIIAPESLSQRLLDLLNKRHTVEDIYRAVDLISNYSFDKVIMYMIAGIETETSTDRDAAAKFLNYAAGKLENTKLRVQINPLIPSPNTVCQRMRLLDINEFHDVVAEMQEKVDYSSERVSIRSLPDACVLYETMTMKGDRRIGNVLEDLHRDGMDLTNLSKSRVETAMHRHNLDFDFYKSSKSGADVLPWHHIKYSSSNLKEVSLLARLDKLY